MANRDNIASPSRRAILAGVPAVAAAAAIVTVPTRPDLLAHLLRLRMEYPELRLSRIAALAGTDNNQAFKLLRQGRLARSMEG